MKFELCIVLVESYWLQIFINSFLVILTRGKKIGGSIGTIFGNRGKCNKKQQKQQYFDRMLLSKITREKEHVSLRDLPWVRAVCVPFFFLFFFSSSVGRIVGL